MTTRHPNSARRALERLAGGPLTLGDFLGAIRTGEGWSQAELARRLSISRAHLCDIEKGRKTVPPARAAHFAEQLGYGREQFVRLALQGLLAEAGLDFSVELRARKPRTVPGSRALRT
ncbi:MAG: helix-turn-helix transcriptional regulator [Deltaproteobacteria bacterium]|nr:helix-turn-helix transcriptional regulator [Deltaproteobacteria bacterium]